MAYKINQMHLQNVFDLSAKERYEHFVTRVCDWEEVWLLSMSEGGVLKICLGDNGEYIPVWPHPEYAIEFSKSEYEHYEPVKIDVYSFVNEFLQELVGTGMKVGTLPNLETTVWIVEPEELQQDIADELEQYE